MTTHVAADAGGDVAAANGGIEYHQMQVLLSLLLNIDGVRCVWMLGRID